MIVTEKAFNKKKTNLDSYANASAPPVSEIFRGSNLGFSGSHGALLSLEQGQIVRMST